MLLAFNVEDFKGYKIKVIRVKGVDKGMIRSFLEFRESKFANKAYEILS